MTEVKNKHKMAEVPRMSTKYWSCTPQANTEVDRPGFGSFRHDPLAVLVKIHTKKWANGIVLIDPGRVNGKNLASNETPYQYMIHRPVLI